MQCYVLLKSGMVAGLRGSMANAHKNFAEKGRLKVVESKDFGRGKAIILVVRKERVFFYR